MVAGQKGERRAGGPGEERDDQHRERDRDDVPAQLLEGDRPTAHGRRGQQVEAALGGLPGQRARQRQDGPQPEHDRRDVADAERDPATERVDVDRRAEQAPEDRRQGAHPAHEQRPRLRRRELRPVWGGGREHQRAPEQPDDQCRSTAVADGLGEDRGESHDPRPRPAASEGDGASGHRSPPRPACDRRTGRGRRPRGSARG